MQSFILLIRDWTIRHQPTGTEITVNCTTTLLLHCPWAAWAEPRCAFLESLKTFQVNFRCQLLMINVNFYLLSICYYRYFRTLCPRTCSSRENKEIKKIISVDWIQTWSFYSIGTASFCFTTEDQYCAFSKKHFFKSAIEYHC